MAVKFTHYEIVTGESPARLALAVMKYLNQGWVPYGSPYLRHTQYTATGTPINTEYHCQAMVVLEDTIGAAVIEQLGITPMGAPRRVPLEREINIEEHPSVSGYERGYDAHGRPKKGDPNG